MLPGVGARVQMQREGLDPSKEIPVGGHHPSAVNDPHAAAQMEDLRRSIESRFASVSTPANFLQAGLFNTLGNNPVTQMISSAGGALGDTWSALMNGPEGEKNKDAKDPLAALNKHTKLLNDILDSLDSMGDALKYMAYEGGGGHGGGGNGRKPGARSGKHVKQPKDGEEELKPKEVKDVDYRTAEEKRKANAAKLNANRAGDEKILDALKKDQVGLREEIEKASDEEKTALEAQLKESQLAIKELEDKLGVPDRTTDNEAGGKFDPDKTINVPASSLQPKIDPDERINMSRDQFESAITKEQHDNASKPSAITPAVDAKPYVPNMDSPTAANSTKFDPDKTINTTVDQLERDATKEVANKNKPHDPDARVAIGPDEAAKMREAALGKQAPKEDKGFFTKMLDSLGLKKASGVMEGFTKAMQKASGELSKSFRDVSTTVKGKSKPLLDAMNGSESAKYLKLGKNALSQKAAPLVKAIKGSETAKYLKAGGEATKDIAKRVAATATGVPAAIATGKAPEIVGPMTKAEQAIAESGVTPNPSALDMAMEAGEAASGAKSVWDATKGAGKKAAGWLGKGANAIKGLAGSGTGQLLGKAAGIAGAGFAGYNAISEEAAGKHVENVGDVVPEGWNKLNPFDWVQRGARYAGNKLNKGYEAVSGASMGSDIYDMFNKDPMKEMNAKAVEADAKKPASMEPVKTASRAEAIEATKEAVDEAKAKPAGSGPDTVIGSVNNTTNKNTTVLPSRQSVNDTDESFKRYVGRSYT
jgi:hypothetical protein